MRRRALILAMLPLILGGCALIGGRRVLGLENGTPLAVTLYANDRAVGTATPGVGLDPIDFASLPPPPWHVEARSPSGRVLTPMTVGPNSVTTTTVPNGGVQTTGAMGRVDLSCGRITIWAGYQPPSGPPPPVPAGSPGDCAPRPLDRARGIL